MDGHDHDQDDLVSPRDGRTYPVNTSRACVMQRSAITKVRTGATPSFLGYAPAWAPTPEIPSDCA